MKRWFREVRGKHTSATRARLVVGRPMIVRDRSDGQDEQC